jgi:hypothetical protein
LRRWLKAVSEAGASEHEREFDENLGRTATAKPTTKKDDAT